MQKDFLKKLHILFYGWLFFVFLTLPNLALAQNNVDNLVWGGYQNEIQNSTGLGDRDPREMIVAIIRIALGFLGVLALTIIILAGFKYMVSGGNEDKAAEAKAMLFNALVGLIIILISLSLANFVVRSILNATQVG